MDRVVPDEMAFRPGFRMSIVDGVVLAAGTVGAVFAWGYEWWLGAMVVCVVGHFFLFCNVFRISRVPELVWAAVFLLAVGVKLLMGMPDWWVVFTFSVLLSAQLIAREMRRPDYHGVGWKRVNPGLPGWFAAEAGR